MAAEVLCPQPGCGTLLPQDAEICDECGSGDLQPAGQGKALLVAALGDRRVAFVLDAGREMALGRSVDGLGAPDVDLGRLPGGDSVHRLHGHITCEDGAWTITHRGRNPIVIHRGSQSSPVEPGGSAALEPGDGLVVGRVRLQFLV
jgi:hypothetical protein